jgi:hypothetical protein
VAHGYPTLNLKARTEVWNGIIGRMDGTKVRKEELIERVPVWAEIELNARQIRNILMTAETMVSNDVDLLDVETVEFFIREAQAFVRLFKKKAESNRNKVLIG